MDPATKIPDHLGQFLVEVKRRTKILNLPIQNNNMVAMLEDQIPIQNNSTTMWEEPIIIIEIILEVEVGATKHHQKHKEFFHLPVTIKRVYIPCHQTCIPCTTRREPEGHFRPTLFPLSPSSNCCYCWMVTAMTTGHSAERASLVKCSIRSGKDTL